MIGPHGVVVLNNDPLLLGAVHLEREAPLGVVGKDQGLLEMDSDPAKQTTLVLWPVRMTLGLHTQRDTHREVVCGVGKGVGFSPSLSLPGWST